MDSIMDEEITLPKKKRLSVTPMEEIYENLIGDEDKDHTSQKVLILNNRNKVILRRTDPYGFVQIIFGKGRTPDRLAGVFTSYHDAEKLLFPYLKSNNIEILTMSDIKMNPTHQDE
jgi:hypothetical protein